MHMEITIQVHPHDVRDEGAETVVRNIVERAGIRSIIVETGTLEERHPYPKGELEHNPINKVVITNASFEIPNSLSWFSELPFSPRLSPQAEQGKDFISDLRKVASPHDAEIIPWVKALNGAFDGDVEKVCVRTFSGELIPTWLCPNNPLTEVYVQNLIFGILERYPSRAVLVDRLRYPDWSGATVSVERMLTCFCPHCLNKMIEAQLDVEHVVNLLTRLAQDPTLLVQWNESKPEEWEPLKSWFRFRNESITQLAERIWQAYLTWQQAQGTETEFWLNLWPPSFASLLGQDYKALGALCQGAKHFPYHRLGGGADLAALVHALAGTQSQVKQEYVFRVLSSLLQLGSLDFADYLANGLPVSFVAEQTDWGKTAFGDNKIFAGIQIWDIPEEEIVSTIDSALSGRADGLFFYCYGWATLSALDKVGEFSKKQKR